MHHANQNIYNNHPADVKDDIIKMTRQMPAHHFGFSTGARTKAFIYWDLLHGATQHPVQCPVLDCISREDLAKISTHNHISCTKCDSTVLGGGGDVKCTLAGTSPGALPESREAVVS